MNKIILFLLFPVVGFAADSKSAVHKCFEQEGKLPVSFLMIKESTSGISEARASLNNSCNEMDTQGRYADTQKMLTQPGKVWDGFAKFGVFAILGHIQSAYTHLDGNDVEKEYMKALEAIKKNPNRYERIRDVYNLVLAYQGGFDSKSTERFSFKRMHIVMTPNATLNNANEKGTGGVCRNFATLLNWSLLQVARPIGSKSLGLDQNSFSMNVISSSPTLTGSLGGHSWVRVNLPFQEKNGIRFEYVDLDTTRYPNEFVPLLRRQSGISNNELNALFQTCKKIEKCLIQAEERSPRPSSIPATQRSSKKSSRGLQ